MRVVQDTLVYRNPAPNYRPVAVNATTCCWSGSGEGPPHLLAAFREGPAKMSPTSRIAVHRSDDLGATWSPDLSPFDTLLGPEAPSQAGSHLGAAAHGTTVLAACRMWIAPPGSSSWNEQAAGVIEADSICARAVPGTSWESPRPFDFRRHGDEWAIPCGPAIHLEQATWLMPVERHTRPHVPDWLRRYHALAVRSADDGVTWSEQAPTLNDPSQRLAFYDQRLERLTDGGVISLAWAHDLVADRSLTARAAVSEDEGRTWSDPWDTGIQTNGAIAPRLLPDGRLLAVYPRREAPPGIRACLSEDGGRSWLIDREFVIWDDGYRRVTGELARPGGVGAAAEHLWDTMWSWSFGTPSPALLPDGRVAVVFYSAGLDAVAEVHCVLLEV